MSSAVLVVNKIPVEEAPTPRLQGMPTVGGVPTGALLVNGAAAAGSKHIVAASGATDVAAEYVAFLFPAGTYSVGAWATLGLSSHPWEGRLLFAPGDTLTVLDDLASAKFTRNLFPGDPRNFDTTMLAASAFMVAVVAVPILGSTLANCVGQINLEAN